MGAWRDLEVVKRDEEQCNWMNFAFGCLSGKLDGEVGGGGSESGGERSPAMGRWMEKGLTCALITET